MFNRFYPVVVMLTIVFVVAARAQQAPATRQPAPTDGKLRIIAFGAHPDDCDGKAGGVGAKWAALGHHVKFVSVTNGDAGHQSEGGGALARRRRAEAQEAGRRIGIDEYETLDHHDGELLPTLQVREQIIREIRRWNADIVLAPRPNDYHPDHRYTGQLVQDSAYLVVVPNVCPDTPALRKNAAFFYFQDGFQRPYPFHPDVVVSIDDVMEKKIRMLDAHASQEYEWLPWVDGQLEQVPKDSSTRFAWFRQKQMSHQLSPELREAARKWYGRQADEIRNLEAFELCEYGAHPSDSELRRLFPFFP